MTTLSFSPEQINSAPPEVRRWFENQIALLLRELAAHPEPVHAPELAACTTDEVEAVFELIRHDFAATQVLLELGREAAVGTAAAGLHALSIVEIKHNLRLPDDRLAECFGVINHAFMRLRHDPEASLFGFDKANHVYIHEATYRSIKALWQKLLQAQAVAGGFEAPHLGPSEDIAGHV